MVANNTRGNLPRGYTALGDGSESHKTVERALRGYYTVDFSNIYEHMTERDLEVRQAYAKDLISQRTGIPLDMILFRKKTEKQTLTAIDEVFYVKQGVKTIGKVSIRSQRLLSSNMLIIIYMSKSHMPRVVRNTGMKTYTKRSKSDIRVAKRQRKTTKRQSY
ncbi:hypothetical protein vBLinoVEfB7_163 [Listeria phage vB_Lino_VEfB7]|nr:hypothetical protein vBLinoVEfB7_163 [Listeria phage vB_Lino_VEfB7]